MNYRGIAEHIVKWLKDYCEKAKTGGFAVGISGGVDSAVTSTLCALTGKKVLALDMPIRQQASEHSRAKEHIDWLKGQYKNVSSESVDLSPLLDAAEKIYPKGIQGFIPMANVRARLRMTTLYAFAGSENLLVAGTGNKIEDFGIGFFTKYGDGGVDLSPIADLYKSEVYSLANELGIVQSITTARPTDGLYADGRTDEDQIGASYDELEWAMDHVAKKKKLDLTARQKEVLEIYKNRHNANKHKFVPVPVCKIPEELKK